MSSLSEWLRQLRTRRPSSLEARIVRLEAQLQDLAKEDRSKPEPGSAVVIEHVNIEHLHIAKLEHSNIFGALGIKELGGRLNIGVNYSGPITGEGWEDMSEAVKKASDGKADKKETQPHTAPGQEKQPVCHIRSKPL